MTSVPTFVGGLMKSGTSLLRKLLSRHSSIYGGLETHWFSDDLMTRWRDPTTQRAVWARQFYDVSDDVYADLARQATSGPDLLDRFMSYCTERAGKTRWVEKTPDNVLFIHTIWDHWPDARVLHVLRDLRDVYASWKRNQKRSLDAFIENVKTVHATVGELATTKTERYMEVRYESMVAEPGGVIQEVCAFLDVPFEPEMVDYQGDDADFEKVLAVTGKASPTTESLKKPIFQSSVGQWKDVLTAEEVGRIETELRSELALWGWA